MLLSAGLLTSCNSATIATGDNEIDVLDKVRSLDILPRQPQQVNALQPNAGRRGRAAVYEGTEVTDIAEETRPQPIASGNGFDLNFENTPVATVAKVVLGDILGTGYAIDPRVQGTVSLVSVKPVPKSDIVFVLENALRLSGVVLVRDTAGYRLTPLGDAVGTGRVDAAASSPEPGYGVSVVPLQYVSAQTLLKLMDSFATKAGMVRPPRPPPPPPPRPWIPRSASTSTGCAVNPSEFIPSLTADRNRSSPSSKRSWIPATAVSARVS
jgi:general secretion pathway protein D